MAGEPRISRLGCSWFGESQVRELDIGWVDGSPTRAVVPLFREEGHCVQPLVDARSRG